MTIEMFTMGKKGTEVLNEDAIFVSDRFIAAIDGCTSKSKKSFDGVSGGKVATNLIIEVLEKCSSTDHVDLDLIMNNIKKSFADFYKANDMYEQNGFVNPVDKIAASMVIYMKQENALYFIGDCQAGFIVAGQFQHIDNKKRTSQLHAEMRAYIIQSYIKLGINQESDLQSNDFARDILLPHIANEAVFANDPNSEFGYPVINGDNVPSSLIRKVDIPNDCKEVVLATDGYPMLFKTLNESEEHLKMSIEQDPFCYKLTHETKGIGDGLVAGDDRAYVRFEV
jgi:glycerophosphoryl diester phosphodiesterase